MEIAWSPTPLDAPLIRHVLAGFHSGSVSVLDRNYRILFSEGRGLLDVNSALVELIGRNLDEVLSPDQMLAISPKLDRAFAGEVAEFDFRHGERTFEIRVTPFQHDGGYVSSIVAMTSDVTQERLTETRLWLLDKAGEALVSSLDIRATLTSMAHLLVNRIADLCAIHLIDEFGEVDRIVVVHADPAMESLAIELYDGFVYNRRATVGPALVMRTGLTEFRKSVTEKELLALAIDQRQLTLLRKMGVSSSIVAPISHQGRVLGAISLALTNPRHAYSHETCALVEDLALRAAMAVENARLYQITRAELTRREQDEEAERLRSAALGRLARSDVIGIVTIEDEWIVEANDVFLRMVGYEPEDLGVGGLSWRAITPAEYAPLDDHALVELHNSGSSTPFEKEYIRSDGTRVPILLGATLIEHQPTRWICFVVDLSARRAFEEAQQAFMEDIGHDLRSPISVTRWAAQLLRRHLRGGKVDIEDLDNGLGTIENSTVRMASLVNGLMDAAQLRMGQTLELHREATDLAAVSRQSVESFRHTTDRHTISIRTAVPSLIGHWDRARLERVLDNLLSNAIKYSPAGGEIVVSLEREHLADGDHAMLTVFDRGIGIDEAELATIFDRFRRGADASAQAPGAGIGLAGAKQIVELHGGSIEVKSHIGEGSTFSVRLPLS